MPKTPVHIRAFQSRDAEAVVELILSIQRDEFDLPISIADQPDLDDIESFYQRDKGNFWVAEVEGWIVGTVALLNLGLGDGALRKMFVAAPFRGHSLGVAQRLLNTLLGAATRAALTQIYLGTASRFLAAHNFYEKNGFARVAASMLPARFPIMTVDTQFYRYSLVASDQQRRYS